jgi:hypothetical protein
LEEEELPVNKLLKKLDESLELLESRLESKLLLEEEPLPSKLLKRLDESLELLESRLESKLLLEEEPLPSKLLKRLDESLELLERRVESKALLVLLPELFNWDKRLVNELIPPNKFEEVVSLSSSEANDAIEDVTVCIIEARKRALNSCIISLFSDAETPAPVFWLDSYADNINGKRELISILVIIEEQIK